MHSGDVVKVIFEDQSTYRETNMAQSTVSSEIKVTDNDKVSKETQESEAMLTVGVDLGVADEQGVCEMVDPKDEGMQDSGVSKEVESVALDQEQELEVSSEVSVEVAESEQSQEEATSSSETPDNKPASKEASKDKASNTEQAKKQSAHVTEFLKEFESHTDVEVQLEKAIEFMRLSLNREGTPQFKDFWHVRRICLPLFKSKTAPSARVRFWEEFSELSREARRIKELLDEQSAFAVEQIEMAISAVENDLENMASLVERTEDLRMPEEALGLFSSRDFYQNVQKELNLLNAYASRINELRKELIRTEMRVKRKNEFFKRLSAVGDIVFPRRKDLIKQISVQFSDDTRAFVSENFQDERLGKPLFVLREEIKALQGMAKIFTLNTQAFTKTRLALSECWDCVKVAEKDWKKQRAQQKEVSRENASEVLAAINAFNEEYAKGEMSLKDADKALDNVFKMMRKQSLGRDEVKLCRDELNKAKKPLIAKREEEEQRRKEEELKREEERQKLLADFTQKIEAFRETASSQTVEQLEQAYLELGQEVANAKLPKHNRQKLEREVKRLSDVISDRKEQALLDLSEDDRDALDSLRQVLQQRTERRRLIKAKLNDLRKQSGACSLDFTKGLAIQKNIDEENERLTAISTGIEEIESKIKSLKAKAQ